MTDPGEPDGTDDADGSDGPGRESEPSERSEPSEPSNPGSGSGRDDGGESAGFDLAARRGLDVDVYQPAEDTRLLARTVIADLGDAGRVLEVGTGSGYVAVALARGTDATVVASDLNPHACRQAAARGREAGVDLHVVRADLLGPFRSSGFDAVVFNPPYLPADDRAARDDWMELALSGGESGRAVVEPFLDDVGRVLRPGGRVYLLVSTLTGVDEVVERAAAEGFSAVALADESYPFETLTVLKLVGRDNPGK